jgi:hypothetical protein
MPRTVKLSRLWPVFDDHDYPMTRAAADRFEDVTVSLADGEVNLGAAVEDLPPRSSTPPPTSRPDCTPRSRWRPSVNPDGPRARADDASANTAFILPGPVATVWSSATNAAR